MTDILKFVLYIICGVLNNQRIRSDRHCQQYSVVFVLKKNPRNKNILNEIEPI